MMALRFETGAGVPDGTLATVRRYLSRVDGEIEPLGGPLLMFGALVRAIEPGRDEILIATGPDGRLQIWGDLATGLHHDRTRGHKHWKPRGWAG